jgi:hypothetical protein
MVSKLPENANCFLSINGGIIRKNCEFKLQTSFVRNYASKTRSLHKSFPFLPLLPNTEKMPCKIKHTKLD